MEGRPPTERIIKLPIKLGGCVSSPMGYGGGQWEKPALRRVSKSRVHRTSLLKRGALAVLCLGKLFIGVKKRRERQECRAPESLLTKPAAKDESKAKVSLIPGWMLSTLSELATDLVRQEAMRRLDERFAIWVRIKLSWKRRVQKGQRFTSPRSVPRSIWKQSFFFRDWPDESINELLQEGIPLVYEPPELLLYQGESHLPGVYILVQGSVSHFDRYEASGSRHLSEQIKAPRILGDASFFVKEHFAHSLTVHSGHIEVVFLPGRVVERVMEALPEAVYREVEARCTQYRATTLSVSLPMTPALVARSSLFQGLPVESLRKVIDLLKPIASQPGKVLVCPEQAEQGQGVMYFLRRGTCKSVMREAGEVMVLSWLRAPQTLSQESLFNPKLVKEIQAHTRCDLWGLEYHDFVQFFEKASESTREKLNVNMNKLRRGYMAPQLQPCIIRSVPLFQAAMRSGCMSEHAALVLAGMFTKRVVNPGEFLATPSQHCVTAFLLMQGVAMATHPQTGLTRRVGFGECMCPALLISSRWVCYIVAKTNCECWQLSREKLQMFVGNGLPHIHPQRFRALCLQCTDEERGLLRNVQEDALYFPLSVPCPERASTAKPLCTPQPSFLLNARKDAQDSPQRIQARPEPKERTGAPGIPSYVQKRTLAAVKLCSAKVSTESLSEKLAFLVSEHETAVLGIRGQFKWKSKDALFKPSQDSAVSQPVTKLNHSKRNGRPNRKNSSHRSLRPLRQEQSLDDFPEQDAHPPRVVPLKHKNSAFLTRFLNMLQNKTRPENYVVKFPA